MNWKQIYVRTIAVVIGLSYVASALALLLTPEWFLDNIGNYPPFNRHYLGDTGSFLLVLGLMLLWAARDPARDPVMIALVGVGSLVHAMNHIVEDFITNPSTSSIVNNVLLFVLSFALLLAARWANELPQVPSPSAVEPRYGRF
jgi:hypothetical protein